MCLPLSRTELQRVVTRASGAADGANASKDVAIPELRVAGKEQRLIGPVRSATGARQTCRLSRRRDGIAFDGGLVMPCQRADVSDRSNDVAWHLALEGQVEVLRIRHSVIRAVLRQFEWLEKREIDV